MTDRRAIADRRPMTDGRRLARRTAVATLVVLAVSTAACSGGLKGQAGPRMMVVGDSIMHDLGPWLDAATGDLPFQRATVAGCPIVRGASLSYDGTQLYTPDACDGTIWRGHQEYLDTFDPDIVVWLGIWEILPRNRDGVVFTPGSCAWEHPSGTLCGSGGDNALIHGINEKVVQLTSRGARLVIATMPPPAPEAPGYPDNSHVFNPPERMHARTEHLNRLLKQVASMHPGVVQLVDFAAAVCPPTGRAPCPTNIPGQSVWMRPDGGHFHGPGAQWAAATLTQMIFG